MNDRPPVGKAIYDDRSTGSGPDYGRVVRSLSDRDVRDELTLGKGDPGYRDALRVEAERRGIC